MPSEPARRGGQQVPDAVADHHGVPRLDPEQRGGGQEQVGVGLGVPDQVPGHHRGVLGEPEELEGGPRGEGVAAGGDRPLHARVGQRGQQLARAGQRGDRPQLLAVLDRVRLLELGDVVRPTGTGRSPAAAPARTGRRSSRSAGESARPTGRCRCRRAPPATRSRAGRRCRSASRRGRTGRMALVPADIPHQQFSQGGCGAGPSRGRPGCLTRRDRRAAARDGGASDVTSVRHRVRRFASDDHHPPPAGPGRLPVDPAGRTSTSSRSRRSRRRVLLAVVVGHPRKPGPYTIRVKAPAGAKLMPHRHHEDRVYTVISGVFYIGLGEDFDPDKLQAYPPGAVVVLPGETAALPLGEVRRVHHPGHGARADQPRLRPPGRRSPALSNPAGLPAENVDRESSRATSDKLQM